MNLKWLMINQWKHKYSLYALRKKLKIAGVKRFPNDYTHAELAALVQHHRDKHVELATKYHETLDKLKETRIELSRLKRNK